MHIGKSCAPFGVMEADDEYRNKVAIAVYEAVVAASRADGDAAVVKTGSAFDALMMVSALLIAGDPKLATPQAIRIFSENAGRSCESRFWQLKPIPCARVSSGMSTIPAGPTECQPEHAGRELDGAS